MKLLNTFKSSCYVLSIYCDVFNTIYVSWGTTGFKGRRIYDIDYMSISAVNDLNIKNYKEYYIGCGYTITTDQYVDFLGNVKAVTDKSKRTGINGKSRSKSS